MARERMGLVGSHGTQAVTNAVASVARATNAEGVLLQSIGADVRFTLDGTDPAAGTTGFLLYNNQPPILIELGDNATALKFIRNASTDASVAYQFIRAFTTSP